MSDLAKLAERTRKRFTMKQRGERKFWTLTEKRGGSDWVLDMVREAHETMLPDDYKYAFVVEALDYLAEGNGPDEYNPEADIYNAELLAWLGSNVERAGFVDEATGDWGHSPEGILGDIGAGQIREKQQAYGVVLAALRAEIGED